MSIKKYEIFAKVVELGSLTRAAEALGLTQSGVSHVISALENEFGFPILRRGKAGVSLTADGEKLLPALRGVINSAEQLNQIVSQINGLTCGTVRIGSFTSVAVHWLPGIIKEFSVAYPNIEIKLLNGDYHDVAMWLGNGEADVGFVAYPEELGCKCTPLLADRLMAVLPPEHPLAGSSAYPLSDVSNEPFISLLETSDHDARRALEAAGVTPNVKYYTKDDYAIIAMVEMGLGVAIMPELLLKGHTDKVVTLPLNPPYERMISLALSDSGSGSPATRAFAEHALRWVSEHAGTPAGALL